MTDVTASRERLVSDLTTRSYRDAELPTGDGSASTLSVIERGLVIGALLAIPVVGRKPRRELGRLRSAISARPGLGLLTFALAVPLAVRLAGVLGEAMIGTASPKLVAAPLYLVLVVGLPLGVVAIARRVRPWRAFSITATAFLVSIAVDFAALGPVVPPTSVLVNRAILGLALGILAASSATDSRRRHWLLAAGAAVWLWGVLTPLGLGIP